MNLKAIWASIVGYAAHPDPRVAATNRVALLIASNQPFYPLFVNTAAGSGGWAAALTWFSTPFFLTLPLVSRQHPIIARALLPLYGLSNTGLAARALGLESGVPLFLFPCALVAAMAFRASERFIMLATLAVVFAAYFQMRSPSEPPLHMFDARALAGLFNLNLFSVAGLTAFIALQFAGED